MNAATAKCPYCKNGVAASSAGIVAVAGCATAACHTW